MKASELIVTLELLINKYGDAEVILKEKCIDEIVHISYGRVYESHDTNEYVETGKYRIS